MTTLALIDRGTGAGTVRFANAAAAAGICPVFGVDVAVALLTPPDPAAGRQRTPVRGGAHVIEPPLRITLPAQNLAGLPRKCPPGVRHARRGRRRAAGRVSPCNP
ncbi:hypothetical protein [Streptomyces sp. NPDC091217]|uniref:hypothetical protein n=1 Tax=Streptomyces sp. NPDC091217 TaxID=3365975 RepID=UPI00381334C7